MQTFDCWWKEGIVYQIYPRSFQDSNQDGIGDIKGVTQRLDYLAWLGVNCIWLSPMYKSPMNDFGYDISDYRSIDPVFGTSQEMDELIIQAHKRHIKVLFDMVLNHTSNQHPWFLESASSINNPKRDFYLWRERDTRRFPNNWYAAFGGRAWTLDERTNQWYLHSFLPEQPDLNWRNDDAVDALFQEIAYWLERGVDGFRLDVINLIIKDEQLRDNPVGWGGRPRPYDLQQHIYDRNRPEAHEKLIRFRSLLDTFADKMLVGEILVEKPGEPEVAASYLGNGENELHLAFDFTYTSLAWNAKSWKDAAIRWESAIPEKGWPCWVMNNHDVRRSASRWKGDGRKARIAALFLLTQRGTPFIYYGEELGLLDRPVGRKHMQDPLGLRYWPFHKGRDGARRPMKWDNGPFHGFTDTEPWLPSDDTQVKSVQDQQADRDSLLYVYHDVMQMRNHDRTLRLGKTVWIDIPESDDILAYVRDDGNERRLLLLNFSAKERSFSALPVQKAMESEEVRVLYSTVRGDFSAEGAALTLRLEPFQGMICAGT